MDFSFCELPVRILCTFSCWVSSLYSSLISCVVWRLISCSSLDMKVPSVSFFYVIMCGGQIHSFLLWGKNESCLKSLSSSSQEYFPVAVSACFMLLCGQSVTSNFCSPINGSTPGFPPLLYLPELAQTRVHGADDAIQPSRPLSPLPQSLPAAGSFPVNQLFGQSIGALASASALPVNIQGFL